GVGAARLTTRYGAVGFSLHQPRREHLLYVARRQLDPSTTFSHDNGHVIECSAIKPHGHIAYHTACFVFIPCPVRKLNTRSFWYASETGMYLVRPGFHVRRCLSRFLRVIKSVVHWLRQLSALLPRDLSVEHT